MSGEKRTPEEIIREGRDLIRRVAENPLRSDYLKHRDRDTMRSLFPLALDALEEARKNVCVESACPSWQEEHDRAERAEAALAKANEATDEARRMYCVVSRPCRQDDPRSVCLATWPDAADRLFPSGGGK